MKILLDAMGGDNAPKSTVQGAADAVKEFGDGMTLALLGDEAKIKAAAQELGVDLTPFELIHCTEDVDMHDDPVKAVRHKTDSSLVKGLTPRDHTGAGRCTFGTSRNSSGHTKFNPGESQRNTCRSKHVHQAIIKSIIT